MPIGRPSKYTPELVEKAWAYITDYEQYGDVFPSVVGLCMAININKSTAYEWATHEDKIFSDILAKVNEASERRLLNGALGNELNSNIAKLVLGKHGYSEKSEQRVDAYLREVRDMSDEELERIANGEDV